MLLSLSLHVWSRDPGLCPHCLYSFRLAMLRLDLLHSWCLVVLVCSCCMFGSTLDLIWFHKIKFSYLEMHTPCFLGKLWVFLVSSRELLGLGSFMPYPRARPRTEEISEVQPGSTHEDWLISDDFRLFQTVELWNPNSIKQFLAGPFRKLEEWDDKIFVEIHLKSNHHKHLPDIKEARLKASSFGIGSAPAIAQLRPEGSSITMRPRHTAMPVVSFGFEDFWWWMLNDIEWCS
jgi:hypothetical protein